MIPQNSNLIMWHVARWSMFSVSLHAVHELDSAFVSFPTVYNVRCQTLVHCSLSRAVTKKDFIFHVFLNDISSGFRFSRRGQDFSAAGGLNFLSLSVSVYVFLCFKCKSV